MKRKIVQEQNIINEYGDKIPYDDPLMIKFRSIIETGWTLQKPNDPYQDQSIEQLTIDYIKHFKIKREQQIQKKQKTFWQKLKSLFIKNP